MQYEYFDIHSHLDVSDFDNDREEVIAEMQKNKIGTITIGADLETSQNAVSLSEKYENVFASVGQIPSDLNSDSVYSEDLEVLADNKKVVAIGECGLDYFRDESLPIKKIQKTIFEYHINLALTKNLPLMLHVRDKKGAFYAYKDSLDILEHHSRISGSKLRGNAHFFAGNLDVLKRFLSVGFSVSFTGVITFTHDYDELIKFAPLDKLMSETDTPFVAPVPYRGKRNSPLYVPEIVKKIAEIRGEDISMVKTQLVKNALDSFDIRTK